MNMTDKAWRKESVLRQLHHENEKYIAEIARELGCTPQTVSRWLDKHGIEKRSYDNRGSAGSDHFNYSESKRREYGSKWERRREQYRQEHDLVCAKCGEQENNTTNKHHIHHVNEEDGRDTNASDVDDADLVALCPSCHISVEVNGYELEY